MKSTSDVVWRLRSGLDRRFRSGHPWVYSNELVDSPKGIEPGQGVELQDASGKFLARGYGNPQSLIAFRAVSRDPKVTDPLAGESVLLRLRESALLRERLGLGNVSHRLVHGEADQLPGLIIDRYRLDSETPAQVYVVQAHSAGADRICQEIEAILKGLSSDTSDKTQPTWENTAIVLRNDLGIRKLEGLEEEEPRVVRAFSGALAKHALTSARIRVAAPTMLGNIQAKPTVFNVDLVGGQKTGFFLDQVANVSLAARWLTPGLARQKSVRILDLCTYVGQWSTQLTRALRDLGVETSVTAVDASATALEFARTNIEAQGARVETMKGDVLRDLEDLPQGTFDLIISDPPALIKGRKAVPAGTHAYLQLNTQVMRLIRPGGAVVCCSCSALMEEEVFLQTLAKAASRNSRTVQWVARGSQSADHPMLAAFPEGRYLKAWIGWVGVK